MSSFVAFLRGMNLGRRRITNEALCEAFRKIGFEEVSAFLASGNVIFSAAGSDSPEGVAARVEQGLRRILDYEVPTFVREAEAVRAIAAREPFSAEQLAAGGKPQVVLFGGEPTADARRSVVEMSTEADRLVLDRAELHWLPRGSILDTELDLKAIERALGTTTTRTKNTLERISKKLPPV